MPRTPKPYDTKHGRRWRIGYRDEHGAERTRGGFLRQGHASEWHRRLEQPGARVASDSSSTRTPACRASTSRRCMTSWSTGSASTPRRNSPHRPRSPTCTSTTSTCAHWRATDHSRSSSYRGRSPRSWARWQPRALARRRATTLARFCRPRSDGAWRWAGCARTALEAFGGTAAGRGDSPRSRRAPWATRNHSATEGMGDLARGLRGIAPWRARSAYSRSPRWMPPATRWPYRCSTGSGCAHRSCSGRPSVRRAAGASVSRKS